MTAAFSMTEPASNLTRRRAVPISLLLFGSGFCALLYQTVWLREFRLVFGNSTAANAAVLSIFMAGVGGGALFFGKRIDRKAQPLRFYAQLELAIALLAAITPGLLWLTRTVYLATGGSESIGNLAAILIRLLLSMVVLAAPTLLMGGTLPAAARAAETNRDTARRNLGLLYGANTLGAVLGVFISTFYLLELLGNRRTLWLGCALNLVVALLAFMLARTSATADDQREGDVDLPSASDPVPPVPLVVTAAGLVGFVFFVMELTWYRMMAPLLGGTAFTFGLILAVALLGVGIGGLIYSFFGRDRRPTLSSFALTCAAEAFFAAIPFALGDRIALLTLLLRPLGAIGFCGHIVAWTILTAIVVFPVAVIAGIQFPLLIALLGQGRTHVGSQTGLAFGSNTLGAIVGALAGGFGLLPALSATGVWKLSGVLLAGLALVAALIGLQKSRSNLKSLISAVVMIVATAALLFGARGPTATWRQSPIGAGREETASITSPNTAEEWLRSKRRWIAHQEDGIESCVGIEISSGIAFVINGKPDGHAILDASTQVMLGLLGAVLHPNPTRALVVGLGSGSTAGWLADIPSMERVDVVELEPAILKVAELCAPVNRNVLSNPKAHVIIGDAREKLLTTREQYDLIVSEPSNPYRAGISSLYTEEYYEAAKRRLKTRGLFVQWVQGYEVDAATIHSIYATLAAAFPFVETWQTNRLNLAFVAGDSEMTYDFDKIRQRIAQPPFREALVNAWRVTDVEGFFSHHVTSNHFAKTVAAFPGNEPNTDDRNAVEFGFARRVGTNAGFNISMIRATALRHGGEDFPARSRGRIEFERVDDQYAEIDLLNGNRPQDVPFTNADEQERTAHQKRFAAEIALIEGDSAKVLESWKAQPRQPGNLTEQIMIAYALADSGSEEAISFIDKIAITNPTDALFLSAILHVRHREFGDAVGALESAYLSCRTNPWPTLFLLRKSFSIAGDIAAEYADGLALVRLYHALEQPFVVKLAESDRRWALAQIANAIDRRGFSNYSRDAIAAFEPDVPWEREFLQTRRACYRALNDPRANQAEHDFAQFLRSEPPPIDPQSPNE